ncbi:uncharacterized protein SCHCODRAFT_02685848 [Schizophyllum commune H4-8]|nr:uncharacterized protein SCHCODRAFT_02685848 [Schizophyllum commune H4-8]KAI5896945.1 hypothetical protein SCHCODRAFT_02685848 [Schizophyllum commune H4-8]
MRAESSQRAAPSGDAWLWTGMFGPNHTPPQRGHAQVVFNTFNSRVDFAIRRPRNMPPPPLSDRVNSQLDRIQAMLRQGAQAQKADQDAVKDWSAEEERRRQQMEAQWQDLSDRLDALYAKVNADAAEGTKLDKYTTKDILTVMKEQHKGAMDELMEWARALQDVHQKFKDELMSILSVASTPQTSNASLHSNNS